MATPSHDRREGERRTNDRRRFWAMNFWLAVLTCLFVYSFVTLQQQQHALQRQQDQQKRSRIEATTQRCDLDQILFGILQTAHAQQLASPLKSNLADCKRLLASYRRDP